MSCTHLSECLVPIHQQLCDLHGQFVRLHSSKVKDLNQLREYQDRLLEIENTNKMNGIWCGNLERGIVPAGQAIMNELFDECHDIIEQIQNVDYEAKPTAGGLIDQAKAKLDSWIHPAQHVTAPCHAEHTDGGLVDRAKTTMNQHTKPRDTGAETHSHHTDGGLVDKAKTTLDQFSKPQELGAECHSHHVEGGLVDKVKSAFE